MLNDFNFANLAAISTPRSTKLGGLLPPLKTILALLIVAIAISAGAWLWTGLWAGAMAGASSYLPILGETILGVLGLAVVNYWFSREINTAMLSTREARAPFVFSKKVNPTSLTKLVDHVRIEVNEHFRKLYGVKHQDIPMPRLLTYAKVDIEVSSEGRNPGKAGIFFSSGCFDYRRNNLDQRQLAALIEMELVKIYLRRGFSRTVVGMGASLANTLQNLNNSEFFLYRVLGILTGPVQFILLLERSLNRSYEYEASKHVVDCGRGIDLMNAIDKKVCNTLETVETGAELKADQNLYKRTPYNGYMKGVIKLFTDWIDENELAGDDKTGYRILSLPDILVREGIYYFNELWKKEPRATNLKNYLRTIIKGPVGNKEVTMGTATSADVPVLQDYYMSVNSTLYNKIPPANRYDVIGPNGSGYVTPILPDNAPITTPIAGGGQQVLLDPARLLRFAPVAAPAPIPVPVPQQPPVDPAAGVGFNP